MFLPLIEILVNGLVDSFLIAACATAAAAGFSVMLLLGALYLSLKAIKDIVRVICGVPDPVVRREFIDADGRRGVEEIPYQPAMNIFNATTQTVRAIQDGRNQH